MWFVCRRQKGRTLQTKSCQILQEEVCSNGSVSADPSVGSAGGLLIGVRLDDLDRCCICGVWCSL